MAMVTIEQQTAYYLGKLSNGNVFAQSQFSINTYEYVYRLKCFACDANLDIGSDNEITVGNLVIKAFCEAHKHVEVHRVEFGEETRKFREE